MDLIELISNVGFPIALCLYFVIKFEKTINKNTEALIALREYIKSKRR